MMFLLTARGHFLTIFEQHETTNNSVTNSMFTFINKNPLEDKCRYEKHEFYMSFMFTWFMMELKLKALTLTINQ